MTIWGCLRQGFLFTVKPQNLVLLGLLLVVQGLAALLIVSPFVPVLEARIGFDPDWTAEESLCSVESFVLSDLRNFDWTATNAAVGLGVLVYLLVATFHTAGILTVIRSVDGRFRFPRFFSGGGVYVLRFVRLLGILFFSLYFINWLSDGVVGPWLLDFRESTRHERIAVYAAFGHQLIEGLAVVFLLITAEYARIQTVVLGRRSMVGSWLSSLWFVSRHPFATFLVYGLTAILDLVFVLGLAFLFRVLPPSSPTDLWIHFGLTLGLFYIRGGIRVLRLGSEAAFFLTTTGNLDGAGGLAIVGEEDPDDWSVEASPSGGPTGLAGPPKINSAGPMGITAPELEGVDAPESPSAGAGSLPAPPPTDRVASDREVSPKPPQAPAPKTETPPLDPGSELDWARDESDGDEEDEEESGR